MTTQVTAACSPISFSIPSFSQIIPLGARVQSVDPEPDARDSALACLRISLSGPFSSIPQRFLYFGRLGKFFSLGTWDREGRIWVGMYFGDI